MNNGQQIFFDALNFLLVHPKDRITVTVPNEDVQDFMAGFKCVKLYSRMEPVNSTYIVTLAAREEVLDKFVKINRKSKTR